LTVEGGQITRAVALGEIVLVKLDETIRRPMIVSSVLTVPIYDRINATVENPRAEPVRHELRISGTIFCEPEDHTLPGLRGTIETVHDPGRIHGRPDRYHTIVYGEALKPGPGIGEWVTRPSILPARS
jgi:hypothetical protein